MYENNVSVSFEDPEGLDAQGVRWAMQAAVAPVLWVSARTQKPTFLGTAFCIGTLVNGQSFFVTAGHIVEALREQDYDDTHPMLLLPSDTTVNGGPPTGVLIDGVSLAESHSDVAMLRINRRSAQPPLVGDSSRVSMAFVEATVGEPTLAMGYPTQELDDNARLVNSFALAHGVVQDVHNHQRDSSLVNFPSFRTSCGYPAGMSGGPVIDAKTGAAIGVVSVGMTSDENSWGYAAALAGILELGVLVSDDDGAEHLVKVAELLGKMGLDIPGGVALEASPLGVRLEWLPPLAGSPSG